jgi:putative N6-adenine-specific DNA methylase
VPRFLALTSKGLGTALESELKNQNYKVLKSSQTRTLFECNWQRLYEAHLMLRTATRILMPVLDFTAYNNEELYNQIRKHDFTKYIRPDQTIKIVTSLHEKEGPFNNDLFISQKVKDAIVDQFRDKYQKRPDVDKQADLQIWVRTKGPEFSVSVDLTGDSLTKRGYRTESGEAPLREHLAAGLLILSKWNPQEKSLLDPMCGSGTFLIEAALMAINRGPGTFRKNFAFFKHLNFQKTAWDEAVMKVRSEESLQVPHKILGFEINPSVMETAKRNIARAGVADFIHIQQRAIKDLKSPGGEFIIVCNPPYGERLVNKMRVEDTYIEMSKVFKEEFKGSELWLLSGNKDLTPFLRMKSERSYSIDNNSIDCKWIKYNLY